MSSFKAQVAFTDVNHTNPHPLWSGPRPPVDGATEVGESNVLLCNGHCKIPVAPTGIVTVDSLDSPLPSSRDSMLSEVASAFFTTAQDYLQGNQAASASHILWFLSASRPIGTSPELAQPDQQFTGPVRLDALSLASKVYKLCQGKAVLYADILSDNCGSITRDFPKAADGVSPSSPQKVTSQNQLSSLLTVLCTRKSNPKAVKSFSMLVLSPEQNFDVSEWMANLAEGASIEEAPVPPLLIIGFHPVTTAATLSASSAYVHATQQLLCVHRPLQSDTYHHHARGGVASLSSWLHQHTDCTVDVVLFVQQQYAQDEDDSSLVPASNIALVDLIVSQDIERAGPAQELSEVKVDLAAARQRINKLEMLLKLKSSASSSDVKDKIVFQKWSDAKFEVDVLREIIVRQQGQIEGLHRYIATLQQSPGDDGGEGVEGHSDSHHQLGAAPEPAPIDVVVSPLDSEHPAQQVADVGVGSSIAFEPTSSVHRPNARIALPMETVLGPAFVSPPIINAPTSSSSSSSGHSSSSSSSDDDTLETLLRDARRERLQAMLQRSFNNTSLYSHELEDDLTKEEHDLGAEDGARVIRWNGAQRTRRQSWRKMYRSIQRAARRPTTVSVIPAADVLKFFDAAFDCGLASTEEIENLMQSIHSHHLEHKVRASGNDNSSAVRPWINARLALSAAWNPLHGDVPKVTSLKLREDVGGQLVVGQTLQAVFRVTAPQGETTVCARLRWYRSHPTAADPTLLHCIHEVGGELTQFDSEAKQIASYRVSSEDAGAYIWFEVVPRTSSEKRRVGAAASVSTSVAVALPFRAPQLLHVRLCTQSSDTYRHPVGRYLFAGDVATVLYELVGWPLEGQSRIRWISAPSHDTSTTRRVECVTTAPFNTFTIPSSCAYHMLQVEVSPMELATGQYGATVTSLAVMVLPRPQVLHVMAPQLEQMSTLWTYSWASGARSSLLGIWSAASLDAMTSDTNASEGVRNCSAMLTMLMSTVPHSKPQYSSRQHLPPETMSAVLKLLRAESTTRALAQQTSSIAASWQHIDLRPSAPLNAASQGANVFGWQDVADVREIVFPQEERSPTTRSDRPCFVMMDFVATRSHGNERFVIAFSNALSAEIFIHLVRYLKSVTQPLRIEGVHGLASTSTAVELMRAAIQQRTPAHVIDGMQLAVCRAWFQCWIGGEPHVAPVRDLPDDVSIEERSAFTSRLFPFLCE